MSYADYTPNGPWTDGQSVTRNVDGTLFSYSAVWNALSIVHNTSGTTKNANGFLVTNLPTPVNPGDAANKAYVDAHSGGGGGLPDAPSDGTTYGRYNATWVNVVNRAGDTMTGLLTLSGAPTASLHAATKAYVDAVSIPAPSSTTPSMNGTGAPGVAVTYSRGDHVHPTDTSRAPLASPSFTGSPTAPTPATGDNSTNLATTAFVKVQGYITGNQSITLSGDASGSGTTTITVTFATVNANVGTYQGITVNAKGLVTAATNQNYAPLASPALTGTPTAPTQSPGDNTTNIATTAFVTAAVVAGGGASPSNANPGMDGTAAPGTSALYSRGDHIHPTDTSRAPLASPALTGSPTAPTATAGTNSTVLATTAFVVTAILNAAVPAPYTSNPAMNGTAAPGVSANYSRGDHVHPIDTSRAPLASPAFTGTPTAPTPATSDNSTNVATTAFVQAQVKPAKVLLNTLTASNSANLQDTTSFTTAYTFYELIFEALIPVTTSNSFNLRAYSGGAFQNTSYLGSVCSFGTSGTTSAAIPTSAVQMSQTNTVSGSGINGYCRIYNMAVTGYCQFTGQCIHANGTIFIPVIFGGGYNASVLTTGVQVFFSTGNISSGVMKIYGIT